MRCSLSLLIYFLLFYGILFMQAKYTEGSIFNHICVMTFASAAGLMSLFMVDLVDMYWLSLLGEVALPAAIGYAGSILLFTLSLSIGLAVGCGAVVSQAIGSGNKKHAQQLVGHVFLAIVLFTIPVSVVVLWQANNLLIWLGATGKAHDFALSYIYIVLPSLPLMGIAMSTSAIMRALGNAKESMYITLIGGFVNAVLDPIFIFTLNMGIEGAATATVLCRIVMLLYGFWLVYKRYELIAFPNLLMFKQDITYFLQTAIPAVLTNLATPVGFAFITAIMAQFGDEAVAGNAIVNKLQPLAFVGLFALSGTVGPIAGQNLGAKQYDRIHQILMNSTLFVVLYCFVACTLLWLFMDVIISAFGAKGDAAYIIKLFCCGFSCIFVFNGITFVTNAMFNNLRIAHWATGFNFAKATIFTMPFVYFGAQYGGLFGVLMGMLIGSATIAGLGFWAAYRKIQQLNRSY